MYLDYYEKNVSISTKQAEDILKVYEDVCKEQGVSPDYEEDDRAMALAILTGVECDDNDIASSIIHNATCASSDVKASPAYQRVKPIFDYLDL